MQCKFVVGQKVVCVNDKGAAKNILHAGNVYTISGFDSLGITIFLHLEELSENQNGWFPHRFRPIKETKTDISIFQEILRTSKLPTKKKELA